MIRHLLGSRRLALLFAASVAVPAYAAPLARPAIASRSASPAPARERAVSIKMFAFTPQVLIVTPGTTVIWTNADEDPHTVTATGNSFHSAALDTGGSFKFTFATPGEFAYFCQLHPHMTGKVIVKAS